jgi:hypothetical protein
MKRYLIITLILVIAATIPITAKQENISLGPYKATFDLNITEPYNTSFQDQHSETYNGAPLTGYYVTYQNSSSKEAMVIGVVHYEEQFDTKYEDDIKILKDYLAKLCNDQDARIVDRKIDGHDGYLYVSNSCYPFNEAFIAHYWIDEVDGYGNTSCMILSTFPWNNGTLNLLKTIHIEELSQENEIRELKA